MEDSILFEIQESLYGDGADLAQHCFVPLVAFVDHLATFIDTLFAAGFKAIKVCNLVTAARGGGQDFSGFSTSSCLSHCSRF
jgi:hypothetical protein